MKAILPDSSGKGKFMNKKMNKVFLLAIFGIYPLVLIKSGVFGIPVQLILYTVMVIAMAIIYIYLLVKKRTVYRTYFCRLDILMLFLVILNLCMLVSKRSWTSSNWGTYLCWAVTAILYFIVSGEQNISALCLIHYLKIYSFSSGIIYLFLLAFMFGGYKISGIVGIIITNEIVGITFLILSITVNVLLYCSSLKKDRFYLILAAIGYYILFLYKDMVSILIIALLLLLVPVIFRTTAEIVKRVLHLWFIYLFILSNMFILNNYSKMVNIKVQYDPSGSIYLDLLFVLTGIVVFVYWERIPKGIESNRIVLNYVRRIYLSVLKFCGIVLMAFVFTGSQQQLLIQDTNKSLWLLLINLRTEIQQADGVFENTLKDYGIIGTILIIMIFANIIGRLRKQYDKDNETALLTMIAIIFMVQAFFYKQEIMTAPLYAVMIGYTVYYKADQKYELKQEANGDLKHALKNKLKEFYVTLKEFLNSRFMDNPFQKIYEYEEKAEAGNGVNNIQEVVNDTDSESDKYSEEKSEK